MTVGHEDEREPSLRRGSRLRLSAFCRNIMRGATRDCDHDGVSQKPQERLQQSSGGFIKSQGVPTFQARRVPLRRIELDKNIRLKRRENHDRSRQGIKMEEHIRVGSRLNKKFRGFIGSLPDPLLSGRKLLTGVM